MMQECKLGCLLLLLIVAAAFGGIYIGRKSVSEKTTIEYVYRGPISGSVANNQLKPLKEETPVNPNLPVRIDTVYSEITKTEIKYITQKVDTAAIIADYILKRHYDITAFDSKELGRLRLFPTIQYNQLSALDYEFTPIEKQITIHKKQLQPFVSGSYSTLGNIGIGGGVFYNNFGFEYQYQKDIGNKNNGHWFGVKYKF